MYKLLLTCIYKISEAFSLVFYTVLLRYGVPGWSCVSVPVHSAATQLLSPALAVGVDRGASHPVHKCHLCAMHHGRARSAHHSQRRQQKYVNRNAVIDMYLRFRKRVKSTTLDLRNLISQIKVSFDEYLNWHWWRYPGDINVNIIEWKYEDLDIDQIYR